MQSVVPLSAKVRQRLTVFGDNMRRERYPKV